MCASRIDLNLYCQIFAGGCNCVPFCRYQFQPHRYNHLVACRILLKSMMILPETNFTLLMAVLPLNQVRACACMHAWPQWTMWGSCWLLRFAVLQQSNEDIERISKLHMLLESCQFCEFWVSFPWVDMYYLHQFESYIRFLFPGGVVREC